MCKINKITKTNTVITPPNNKHKAADNITTSRNERIFSNTIGIETNNVTIMNMLKTPTIFLSIGCIIFYFY